MKIYWVTLWITQAPNLSSSTQLRFISHSHPTEVGREPCSPQSLRENSWPMLPLDAGEGKVWQVRLWFSKISTREWHTSPPLTCWVPKEISRSWQTGREKTREEEKCDPTIEYFRQAAMTTTLCSDTYTLFFNPFHIAVDTNLGDIIWEDTC